MSRSESKKRILKDNDMGKRIRWCRLKLELGFMDIERLLGIPECNIRVLENGSRTTIYEDLYKLAVFFQKELRERFKTPLIYDGIEVEVISFQWLLFGYDKDYQTAKALLSASQDDFRARELELIERNFDLDAQLRTAREKLQENNLLTH